MNIEEDSGVGCDDDVEEDCDGGREEDLPGDYIINILRTIS